MNVEESEPDCLAIYASFGLGRTVVEGRDSLDRYVIEKHPPYQIRSREIARKDSVVRPAAGGGEEEVNRLTRTCGTSRPYLEETIDTLVKWALPLERYFKRPQEIEWAVDETGKCWLLQCPTSGHSQRPLTVTEDDICESCSAYPILIKDKGVVAHTGVGSGPRVHGP